MSRYPPIPPDELVGEQKQIYKEMKERIDKMFPSDQGFTLVRKDGALLGPFAPVFYTPIEVARHFMDLVSNLNSIPNLPHRAREIAILTVGAHFDCAYEQYAHRAIAGGNGILTKQQVDDIASGRPPSTDGFESDQAKVLRDTYDITTAMINEKGALREELYQKGIKHFGKYGFLALVHYTGFYSYISIYMNAADVQVPKEGE